MKGGRNQQKQFHGKGTLEYDNGSYIAGKVFDNEAALKFHMLIYPSVRNGMGET